MRARCWKGYEPFQCRRETVKRAAWESTLARVKLKGIGGGAPQGVKPAVQLDPTPGNLPGATAE